MSILDYSLAGKRFPCLFVSSSPGQLGIDSGVLDVLMAHGAQVVAIDASSKMIKLAKQRLGTTTEIYLRDLRNPLPFEDASFDIILCSFVLDYIRDWPSVFQEFSRVLAASGPFIFSIGHPFTAMDAEGAKDYFAVEAVQTLWPTFGIHMPSFRRPLAYIFNTLAEAGFVVESVLEPLPTDECCTKYPKEFARLSAHPGFLCIRASQFTTPVSGAPNSF